MKKMATAADLRHTPLQTCGRGRLLFRVDPVPMESPRGYLCRVAHAHAYYGPWWLADLAGITPGRLERKDRGMQLAYVLRLETSEWLKMCYRTVKGNGRHERRSFLSQVISADQLNFSHPRICPRCLCDHPVWWAIWDLKLVSACPIHRCLLIDRCPACQRRLTWHRRSVYKCRCGLDLRKVKPETAEENLVTINAAIYRAAGFFQEDCQSELRRANFLPVVADLQLDALLKLARFLGSIQEGGILRRDQIRSFAKLGTAMKIGIEAATVLSDWPGSFREMLKRMVPTQVENTDLNFHNVFGNFFRHLYTVLPRKEFGFLHNAFEEFVVEDWKGLVRGQHYLFAPLTRKHSQWMSAQQAETTMHVNSKRLAALVRNRELEGIFVKTGRQHTECWIRRESLKVWSAKREADLARYMSCPEAKRTLGLKHETLLKVAQAGLVRYVSGAERSFRSNGFYFLREDVSRIKHAFEKHAAHVQPYTGPGKLIALRHALKNYLGRDSGLPAAIRAVVDGRLVPVGYTKRFPGITGYLFPSEDLRKYRPVQTEMPSEGLLNFKEAASALGTRSEVIRGLVSQGILSTPNKYRVGLSKLVPAGEVQLFAEEYVDASILAEHSNETIHWVKRALRESGVPILEISVPEKGKILFLHRDIAATVHIPQRYERQRNHVR
jgi:hypothetical protein